MCDPAELEIDAAREGDRWRCYTHGGGNIADLFGDSGAVEIGTYKIVVLVGASLSRISVTTDFWTAPNQQQYLGVTIHWMHNWQIESLELDLAHHGESHNSANCAEWLVCRSAIIAGPHASGTLTVGGVGVMESRSLGCHHRW